MNRGARLVELLKQGQYQPMDVAKQVIAIFAGVSGFLDHIPAHQVVRYEQELLEYLQLKHEDLLKEIKTKRQLDEGLKEKLKKAIQAFNADFQ